MLTDEWKALRSRLRNFEPSLLEFLSRRVLPYITCLTNSRLVGLLGWWMRRAFEKSLGKLSKQSRTHQPLPQPWNPPSNPAPKRLEVARKLGMLEQLGSDYNNSLSFHGWRRELAGPMPCFLTLPQRRARHKCF